ncbi:Hypothetical predicted protein [Octopus vulgaris]|uniref:Uncharacterized protein n=1 Tax=Octopus vulgaris TaxID=6645 RepID=A0AA36AT41_OCTVU|nr:Hypothetical predicted protein [Octopus vulgaris]
MKDWTASGLIFTNERSEVHTSKVLIRYLPSHIRFSLIICDLPNPSGTNQCQRLLNLNTSKAVINASVITYVLQFEDLYLQVFSFVELASFL